MIELSSHRTHYSRLKEDLTYPVRFLFLLFVLFSPSSAMAEDPEIAAARQRMIARRFGGASASTGGKGTVRRKHKAVHKTATSDDKKLGSTLKKLGVTNIPAIEEVNLFTSDQKVIHFQNPKVQASIAANTYVVSGPNETKNLTDMLPGILNQVLLLRF